MTASGPLRGGAGRCGCGLRVWVAGPEGTDGLSSTALCSLRAETDCTVSLIVERSVASGQKWIAAIAITQKAAKASHPRERLLCTLGSLLEFAGSILGAEWGGAEAGLSGHGVFHGTPFPSYTGMTSPFRYAGRFETPYHTFSSGQPMVVFSAFCGATGRDSSFLCVATNAVFFAGVDDGVWCLIGVAGLVCEKTTTGRAGGGQGLNGRGGLSGSEAGLAKRSRAALPMAYPTPRPTFPATSPPRRPGVTHPVSAVALTTDNNTRILLTILFIPLPGWDT